jgi:hypothetical protein
VGLAEQVEFTDADLEHVGRLAFREEAGQGGEIGGFHRKNSSTGIPVALENLIALSTPSLRRPFKICESSEGDMPISLANSDFLIFLCFKIFFKGFIWLPANNIILNWLFVKIYLNIFPPCQVI